MAVNAGARTVEVGGRMIELVAPGPEREALLPKLLKQYPGLIAVDYTVVSHFKCQVLTSLTYGLHLYSPM